MQVSRWGKAREREGANEREGKIELLRWISENESRPDSTLSQDRSPKMASEIAKCLEIRGLVARS